MSSSNCCFSQEAGKVVWYSHLFQNFPEFIVIHTVKGFFQGKPFNITVIQVYTPASNSEEAEVEWSYKDLQDLLELTPKKDVLFIIGDWNAKVGSQETPGVTGKFGLGIHNEAGQRLIEFCQENALVITNTLFQQHRKILYIWTSPDGQHRNQIDYILCSQRWRSSILYTVRTAIRPSNPTAGHTHWGNQNWKTRVPQCSSQHCL